MSSKQKRSPKDGGQTLNGQPPPEQVHGECNCSPMNLSTLVTMSGSIIASTEVRSSVLNNRRQRHVLAEKGHPFSYAGPSCVRRWQVSPWVFESSPPCRHVRNLANNLPMVCFWIYTKHVSPSTDTTRGYGHSGCRGMGSESAATVGVCSWNEMSHARPAHVQDVSL